jgi:hypothetical protein
VDPSIVGARLASSFVTPLIKRLFRTDDPGAGIVDRPVRIRKLVSFKGEKRTLSELDMQQISEQLVDRSCHTMGHNEGLPGYEIAAVKGAVIHSLRALGDLDMEDVQAVRLGHRALARRLMSESPRATDGLSQDAVYIYESVVETACMHILHFFTQRSSFVARTLVEQTRQLSELLGKVDELINRTPSPGDGVFEDRYSEYISHRYSELTIFGLNLTESPESWPLDAAYLSLEVASDSSAIPAELMLAGKSRVLLRGVAGSGKTTLIQWLATATARQGTDERLLYLSGMVPIVLPLRAIARRGLGLPLPEKFLESVGCPIAGLQPTGWIDRVLKSGRGLLLVDGVDETPQAERRDIREWLRDLVRTYPTNRWLVTSRPSAVRQDWLSSEEFTELDLVAMSRENVTSFIKRWHHAAGVGDTYVRSLKHVIWSKQDLARLATNPLMCGLICALHRDRRGYLPDSRKEMYDAALSMLLSRRDRERGLEDLGEIRISEEAQVQLLQKLAYWMIRNGRSEMDKTDAMDIFGRVLPAMPRVAEQGNPQDVYRHIMTRSGLLREPSIGRVDFIHRTFQDYLAARSAVEELDFDLLVANSYLDLWEDVVRMAVAHARPNERARLLTSLIHYADSCGENGRRIYLLAAACLEHATELDPTVWAEVRNRAARFIPPTTEDQARALAEVGPVALELLPGPETVSADESYLIVFVATRIGTDAALPKLIEYRHSDDIRVRNLLARAWANFDTEHYADEVIRHLNPERLYFSVTTNAELDLIASMGGRPCLEVSSSFLVEHFRFYGRPGEITHLRIAVDGEMSCTWLSRFHNLREISITTALSTVNVSAFSGIFSLRRITVPSTIRIGGAETLPDHIRLAVAGQAGE